MRAFDTATREYTAIATEYGARTTRRSRVPLIRHIDEGLAILVQIDASDAAMRAYCLHPFVQADAELAANASRLRELTDDPYVLALAFEYRATANATLSTRAIAAAADIPLSPLVDVNAMLVADKVQNRSDFLAHHQEHPRAAVLDRYFRLWLERLDVSETRHVELTAGLRGRRSP